MRFTTLTAITVALTTALLTAQTPAKPSHEAPPKGFASVEILWPNGAPGAIGKDVSDIPRLYAYPAPGPGPHAAVVILPGGGYIHLMMEKEGAAEARFLNTQGVSAYVLQYRLNPQYNYPAPMLDGERAIRYVRAHATAWNLRADAIGVWGFSAGGHLAGYLATNDPHALVSLHPLDTLADATTRSEMMPATDDIDKLSAHPDFAIISYGRLSLDPAIEGTFGMKTLIGENPTPALLDAVDPIKHITKDTAPTFLFATETDEKVDSQNDTLFFAALHRAGVPAELHIFEAGPHGVGLGQNLPKWPELAILPTLLQHWMQIHGWIPPTP